jgi:SH3-like domain-containing protein
MKRCLLLILVCLSWSSALIAADEDQTDRKAGTGLPLPRFAALRSDEVNMRTGPGTRYPIEWVYRQEGLPVEIIAEFEIWRRVRDWEGSEGWVHKASLTGRRHAIITAPKRDLLASDAAKSGVVAHLEQGAIGQVDYCDKEWCRIKFGNVKGYLAKTDFWGAYPNEEFK